MRSKLLPHEVDGEYTDDQLGAIAHQSGVVTQEQIVELATLQQAHRRFEELKQQLNAALDYGASIEPGPLGLERQLRESRALKVDYLVEALHLSQDTVASLRASAPVRVSRHLVVR